MSWEFTGNLILWVITKSQHIDGVYLKRGDLDLRGGLQKKSWVVLVFFRKDRGRVDTPMHTICQVGFLKTMKQFI